MAPRGKKTDEFGLLQAVIARRPGAWDEFYSRYERLVIACIRKVLHRYGVPCLQEDLEDLKSTVCLQLVQDDYHKLRRYDATRGYKVSSWVGLIATNAAHDALRRRDPRTFSMDDEDAGIGERVHDGPSPVEHTEKSEQVATLNKAVRELSPSEQLFLRYYYQENLEPDQIAALMGISVNTVYSRKNKVRNHLKKIVERMEAEGE